MAKCEVINFTYDSFPTTHPLPLSLCDGYFLCGKKLSFGYLFCCCVSELLWDGWECDVEAEVAIGGQTGIKRGGWSWGLKLPKEPRLYGQPATALTLQDAHAQVSGLSPPPPPFTMHPARLRTTRQWRAFQEWWVFHQFCEKIVCAQKKESEIEEKFGVFILSNHWKPPPPKKNRQGWRFLVDSLPLLL